MLKWRFEQSCISDRQLKSADICYSFLVIRILAKVPASLVFSMLSDCAEVWISPDILHPLTANLLVAMATEQTLMIKISPCWKWAEEFREQLLTFWLQTRLSGSLCDCRTGKLILYCVWFVVGVWLQTHHYTVLLPNSEVMVLFSSSYSNSLSGRRLHLPFASSLPQVGC